MIKKKILPPSTFPDGPNQRAACCHLSVVGINYLSQGWERHILHRAAPTDVDIKQVGCLLPGYREDQPGAHWDWQVCVYERHTGCTTKQQSLGREECALGPLWEARSSAASSEHQPEGAGNYSLPAGETACYQQPCKGEGVEPTSLILVA